MTRSTSSLTERLQKLEEQKQILITKRKEEILKIIEATGALTIDDKLLARLLLFLRDDKNKNHPIMEELKHYLPKPNNNKRKTVNENKD